MLQKPTDDGGGEGAHWKWLRSPGVNSPELFAPHGRLFSFRLRLEATSLVVGVGEKSFMGKSLKAFGALGACAIGIFKEKFSSKTKKF